MKYADPKNTEIGAKVVVPIHGEFMHDEQICIGYTVVKALKCNVPQNEQIVAEGQEPMPILMEFTPETALE